MFLQLRSLRPQNRFVIFFMFHDVQWFRLSNSGRNRTCPGYCHMSSERLKSDCLLTHGGCFESHLRRHPIPTQFAQELNSSSSCCRICGRLEQIHNLRLELLGLLCILSSLHLFSCHLEPLQHRLQGVCILH